MADGAAELSADQHEYHCWAARRQKPRRRALKFGLVCAVSARWLGASEVSIWRNLAFARGWRALPRCAGGYAADTPVCCAAATRQRGSKDARRKAPRKGGFAQKPIGRGPKKGVAPRDVERPVPVPRSQQSSEVVTPDAGASWFTGAISAVAGWATGGIANAAAEINAARAVELAKPLLVRQLGGTSVQVDPFLEKTFSSKGQDALVHLTFKAYGSMRSGTVKLVAAVVQGGIMEIRDLRIDGAPVQIGGAMPASKSSFVDVEGSTSP